MRDRGMGSIGVGLSSIILIGVVLCFTVFAALALLSAHNDAELNDRSTEAVRAYYAADARAQGVIAHIDELAAEGGDINIDGVSRDGEQLFFEIAIDGTRTLFVRLEPEGDGYTVTSYKTRAAGDWTPAAPQLR